MPTNYSGNPTNVTTPAALTITGVTNTIPATVTVSGSLPSDFFTAGLAGAAVVRVTIFDVQGAGLANGVWNATATGTSTFTIDNAVAPGTYSSGGKVQPLCLSPIFTVPSDGDLDNQASIAPMVEALADRSQFLASRTGVAKLAARWQLTWSDLAGSDAWAVFNSTATANTWFGMPVNGSSAFTVQGNIDQAGSTSIASTSPGFGIDGVTVNDTVHVVFDSLMSTGTGTAVRLGLWGTIVDPGIARPDFSTSNYSQFPGCSQIVPFSASAGINLPVHLDGWMPCNLAPALGQNTGVFYIWPAVYSLSVTGAVTWILEGDTSLVIEVWRQTGVPQ